MKLLQNSRPIGESISHKLSGLSWQRGIANFFLETIPFSFSIGEEFSEYLTGFIQTFAKTQNIKSLRIMEVGGGLGFCYVILFNIFILICCIANPIE